MRSYFSSIIIALSLLVGVVILASAYKYKYKAAQLITVTGLAENDFMSDQIIWSGTFSRTGSELKSVYALLKADETEIKNYLNNKNVADSNLVFSSVDIQKNYNNDYDNNGRLKGSYFSGYTLIGKVTVDSRNIQNIEKLSREITELLEKGIEFNSIPPRYYYTQLNELKIDLLAKASADAKLRAETIAKNSGAKLGAISKASMGVFQITGKNSNEDYSYGGVFNTSSKEKTASITLKVEYLMK